MNSKYLTGLCAAIAALSFAPAASARSSESNITCSLEARGGGVELEDYAVADVKCLSLTEMSYTVHIDLSVQEQDVYGTWFDPHICGHETRTATAVNGVAVV